MGKITKTDKSLIKSIEKVHQVWHKFSNWMIKTYGKDLHGKWKYFPVPKNSKAKKIRYRSFNDYELSKRIVGHEVINKVSKYIRTYCPEIKIVPCDDSDYSSSCILLIPHPKHGITIMFIPQCSKIQNQFFLYDSHYDVLMKELIKMKRVYSKY